MKVKISDNIYFEEKRNCIIINEKLCMIEKKQSDVLVFFMKNKNIVLSKEDILKSVWGGAVSIPAVTQAIFRLRKVFKDHSVECPIITVPRRGYVYDPNVLCVDYFERKVSFNKNRLFIAIFIFIFTMLFIVFFHKKEINSRSFNETCSVVNCRNIIYLDVTGVMKSSDAGLLKLIKWHFKANYNINISSSEFANSTSTKRLFFDFNNKHIKYIDSELELEPFRVTYTGSISKEDGLDLMVNLERFLLIKNKHPELVSFYNELPENKEAFDLLLSSLGGDGYSLFSENNIDKLELAYEIEPYNQYLMSLNYMMNIFHIYGNTKGKIKNKLISDLNEKFIYESSKIPIDDYSPKMNEAYAAYYMTKNNYYEALRFLNKVNSNEKTVIGMFLNAKINEKLDEKPDSDLIYNKLSEYINAPDLLIMMKSF